MMKWFAIAALLALAVLWRSSDSRTLIAGFVVCTGAIVAMLQATRVRKYGWILAFLAIAVLFNPLVPMVFSRGALLDFVCRVPGDLPAVAENGHAFAKTLHGLDYGSHAGQ